MITKFWQIIKDDSKRTFEVCGQCSSENSFTNKIYGMQKAGMNVSGITPPVTNKVSHKTSIVVTGYKHEDGLYKRLQAEYMKRSRSEFE